MCILVSFQHTQVPLLQGDAVDHDEVIQVVLGRCCSYWDPSNLGNGVKVMRQKGRVKEKDAKGRE